LSLNNLSTEWQLLQQQNDHYETWSLIIKLVNIILLPVMITLHLPFIIIVPLLLTLWLQDAIWKTFQARGESRLLVLEKAIAKQTNRGVASEGELADNSEFTGDTQQELPFQYNHNFLKERPSTEGLIIEYLKQALRPTIAFPHILLVVLFLAYTLMN